jgi:hypothetical protein
LAVNIAFIAAGDHGAQDMPNIVTVYQLMLIQSWLSWTGNILAQLGRLREPSAYRLIRRD